jgi:outer membrane protein
MVKCLHQIFAKIQVMASQFVVPFACIFCVAASATAQAAGCTDDASATATSPCQTMDQFHFSLAMGAGFRSNPLYGGRNMPLWLMPDLAYYGQHWFFDNGTLGYSWALSDALTLSLVSRLNEEQGYFRRASLSNVFSAQKIAEDGPVQRNDPSIYVDTVEIGQVNKRPWALDGGLQLDWQKAQWQVKANWWHDISNEYQGSHAKITVAYHVSHRSGDWGFSSALAWKSAQLLDTYYGISADDGGNPDVASAGFQPEVGVHWSYALNEHWALLSLYRYRWLNIDLQNSQEPEVATQQSPLLAEAFVRSWFIGVSYRFY